MGDVAKTCYQPYVSGVPLHICSALTSGLIYSVVTLPIDTAKTRMQNQKPLPDGTIMYTSLTRTIGKIASTEGPLSLMNGFGSYFTRCGGHTVFMFLFMEQYKKLVDTWYPKEPPARSPKQAELRRHGSFSATTIAVTVSEHSE